MTRKPSAAEILAELRRTRAAIDARIAQLVLGDLRIGITHPVNITEDERKVISSFPGGTTPWPDT